MARLTLGFLMLLHGVVVGWIRQWMMGAQANRCLLEQASEVESRMGRN